MYFHLKYVIIKIWKYVKECLFVEYIFLCLGIIITIVFLTKRTAKVTLNVAFLKSVASMCFILTGLFSFVGNESCPRIVGALVAVGAAWGMLGDIALDLKYIFKKYEESYLTAGFGSFLVGHIFYSAAMVNIYGVDKMPVIFACVVALVSLLFVMISEPLLKVKYGKFKKITALYMTVLGATVGLSIGYAISTGFDVSAILLAVGFLLFLASDAVLAGLYFSLDSKKRVHRPDIVLNHSLYYAAQFTIAISLSFIK